MNPYLSQDDPFQPSPAHKSPSWVITFADLMTLLMCFFVLLLSYSEMDAEKFKHMALSLQESLGATEGLPIALEPASPSQPQPAHPTPASTPETTPPVDPNTLAVQVIRQKLAGLVQETREDALQLRQSLATQLEGKVLEIDTQGRNIIVRLPEQGNFDSGSAELTAQSRQLLNSLRPMLLRKPGSILVQGHTDDNPIKTSRFRSNWELSSVRAVAVAEALMQGGEVAAQRFEVTGLADTRPLVSNSSPENRARNRRVEIVISQYLDAALSEDDKQLLNQPQGQQMLQQLQLPPNPTGKPLPTNIF